MMGHLFNDLPQHLRGAHAADSASLAPMVAAAVRPDDIVTVKGSNSMGMSKIVAALGALSSEPSHKLAG